MSGPDFIITRIEDPRDDPDLARQLLRNALGVPTVRGAIANARAQSALLANAPESFLTIADDAAFLMIGNTAELRAALRAAQVKPKPLWNMATATSKPLLIHYAQIRVSPIQTDVVIVIASADYWGNVDPLQQGWSEPQTQPGSILALFNNLEADCLIKVFNDIDAGVLT